MIRAAVIALAALLLPLSPALAASIEAFAGDWHGVAIDSQVDEALELSDLNLRIRPDGNGFRMSWTAFEGLGAGHLVRTRFSARFAPSGRPGVFAYDDDQRSFLTRMFASPQTGNPLEGETLLWGRIEDQVLVVYGLSLQDDGGFELYRVEATRQDDGLTLERSIRTGHERTIVLAGRLERVGD